MPVNVQVACRAYPCMLTALTRVYRRCDSRKDTFLFLRCDADPL